MAFYLLMRASSFGQDQRDHQDYFFALTKYLVNPVHPVKILFVGFCIDFEIRAPFIRKESFLICCLCLSRLSRPRQGGRRAGISDLSGPLYGFRGRI